MVAPAFRSVREEHLADSDELIPHLLMADIRRWMALSVLNESSTVQALLEKLEVAVVDNDAVDDIVYLSFLEGLGLPPTDKGEDVLRLYLGPVLKARLVDMEARAECSSHVCYSERPASR